MSNMLVLMSSCPQPAGLSGSLDHWVDGIVCHCLSAQAIIESRMEDVKPPFKRPSKVEHRRALPLLLI